MPTVQDRVGVLIETFSASIDDSTLEQLRTFIRVGEEGCALHLLISVIYRSEICPDKDDIIELQNLTREMEMQDEILHLFFWMLGQSRWEPS